MSTPRWLLPLVLSLVSLSVAAQPSLVKDVNTDSNGADAVSSAPIPMAAIDGFVYIYAPPAPFPPFSYAELWRSDGTAAGTLLLHPPLGQAPILPGVPLKAGSTTFFSAGDSAHGFELWATDGTAAGTHLVADINPGPVDSKPSNFFAYNGQLLFSADDGVHGSELWRSNGTAAGTQMVADLNPGSPSSSPAGFALFGDKAVFAAPNLTITDGTAAGTKALTTAPAGSIVVSGGRIFFVGTDAGTGSQLWVSDGTAAGTHVVKQIASGGAAKFAFSRTVAAVANGVVFFANDGTTGFEPWFSDGTANGTHLVTEINLGAGSAVSDANTNLTWMTSMNGAAYFAANDGVHGIEVWRCDGTAAGTYMLADVAPGLKSSSAASLAATNGRLWWTADNGSPSGPGGNAIAQVWVSDGTAAGTRVLTGGGTQTGALRIGIFPTSGGRTYFGNCDDLNGCELWSSDGTPEGTSLVANLFGDPVPSSHPKPIAALGNRMFFLAEHWPHDLWVSDGTSDGTQELQILPTDVFGTAVAAGGKLYLPTSPVVASDGTPAGTQTAPQPIAGATELLSIGGMLYGRAKDGSVFRSDGTPAGTTTVAPDGKSLFDFAGHLAFVRQPINSTKVALWERLDSGDLHEISQMASIANVATAGGLLYVFNGPELWVSDGTAEGTRRIATLSGQLQGPGTNRAAVQNLLMFVVQGLSGSELWRSDGTEGGTFKLTGISWNGDAFAALDDRLLFTNSENTHGSELWVSDGTVAGTALLVDINPGRPDTFISGITAANGIAYFDADDGIHGRELWRSDGTAGGTFLAGDIEPGATGSGAGLRSLAAGDTLFFNAATAATGDELWKLPLPPVTISINDIRVSENAPSATLTVRLGAPSSARVTADWITVDGIGRAGVNYTSASGSLTFEPGETRKDITVALLHDSTIGNRPFYVRLRNVTGAARVKTFGTVFVEDADGAADLQVTSSTLTTVTVKNAGPSIATGVTLRTRGGSPQFFNLDDLPPGSSRNVAVSNSNSLTFGATATATQRDPNSTDNSITRVVLATSFGPVIVAPGSLVVGSPAKLTVNVSTTGTVFTIDPNPNLTMPASVTTGTPVDILPLAPADTSIVLHGAGGTIAVPISIVANGQPSRWPSLLQLDLSAAYFGQPMIVIVRSTTVTGDDGKRPTGIVELREGGQLRGSAPFDANGIATVFVNSLPIGSHFFTASYNGDARFQSASASGSASVVPAPVTIRGSLRPISETQSELTISVTGSPLAVPTGRLTVSGAAQGTLIDASLVNGTVTKTVSLVRGTYTLTASYTGDTNYLPFSQSIVVTPVRRRATH